MDQCPFQPRISAYHDRELRGEPLVAFEAHLAACPACTAELASLRKISDLFTTATVNRMSQMGLARLHATADASAATIGAQLRRGHWGLGQRAHRDRLADSAATGGATSRVGLDVFPLARALLVVAASVLIICGAWLIDLPRTTPTISLPASGSSEAWQELASGGKLALPREIAPESGLARALDGAGDPPSDFSRFMVRSLKGDGGL